MSRLGLRHLCAFALGAAFLASAAAQDSCRDVFIRDLGNKQTTASNQDSSLAQFHARCIKQSASSSSGGKTSAGGMYDGIGANFDQGSSSSSNSSASDCGQAGEDQHFSAALYYAQAVYRDVVDAWKTCMTQRENFACWPERDSDPNHVTVHLSWTYFSQRPKVIKSSVKVGNKSETQVLRPGSQLLLGDNIETVDRKTNESVDISVAVSPDDVVSRSCHVWVPAVPAEPKKVVAPIDIQDSKECLGIATRLKAVDEMAASCAKHGGIGGLPAPPPPSFNECDESVKRVKSGLAQEAKNARCKWANNLVF